MFIRAFPKYCLSSWKLHEDHWRLTTAMEKTAQTKKIRYLNKENWARLSGFHSTSTAHSSVHFFFRLIMRSTSQSMSEFLVSSVTSHGTQRASDHIQIHPSLYCCVLRFARFDLRTKRKQVFVFILHCRVPFSRFWCSMLAKYFFFACSALTTIVTNSFDISMCVTKIVICEYFSSHSPSPVYTQYVENSFY